MEDLLSYFSEVTGVDNERARFHLDAADWDLQVALANFYECSESSPALNEQSATATGPTAPENSEKPSDEKRSSGAGGGGEEEGSGNSSGTDDSSKGRRPSQPIDTKTFHSKPKMKSNVRCIGTLDLLQNRESSSDEEGQAFYAGGSKHSGQQVLGPSKKNDIINDMFKSCQSFGAVDKSGSQQQHRPNTFGGTGYKLGQTSGDTEVVSDGTASAAATATTTTTSASGSASSGSTAIAPPSTLQTNSSGLITLKLWRDGFTINDREIRSYTEPENREFLAAIKRGEIPMEIREEVRGAEVRLDMEDHRHEEYVPPKPKVKAFTGRGHKLGSPSPATVGMTVPTDPADQAANESQARTSLNLDTSRPVTSIQIRLADGNNIREQFNTSHTIGDVRRFITTMRPQYALQEFSLLTTYPSRELSEDGQTIQQAGLENSAIMQRLK